MKSAYSSDLLPFYFRKRIPGNVFHGIPRKVSSFQRQTDNIYWINTVSICSCLFTVAPRDDNSVLSLHSSVAAQLDGRWMYDTSERRKTHRVPLQPSDLLLCTGGETCRGSIVFCMYSGTVSLCCGVLRLYRVPLQQLEPRPVRHLVALTAITSLGCAVSVISCVALIVYLLRKR